MSRFFTRSCAVCSLGGSWTRTKRMAASICASLAYQHHSTLCTGLPSLALPRNATRPLYLFQNMLPSIKEMLYPIWCVTPTPRQETEHVGHAFLECPAEIPLEMIFDLESSHVVQPFQVVYLANGLVFLPRWTIFVPVSACASSTS